MSSPASEYTARLARWQTEVAGDERAFRLIGNIRLAAALVAVILGFFIFGKTALSPWWFLLPGIPFLVLVVRHRLVAQKLDLARRAVRFYEHGLARLEDRWSGIGETGERFRDPEHVYAEDLDLFGSGSLYQLLSNARTRPGEDTLAHWLLSPASPAEIAARQEAIRELAPDVSLRERIALSGEDGVAKLNSAAAISWGGRPEVRFPAWAPSVAGVLAAATVISVIVWLAGFSNLLPLFICILAELAFAFFMRSLEMRALEGLELQARDLGILSQILRRLEERPAEAPLLGTLQENLKTGGFSAAEQIARLERIVDRLEWMHNKFFQPIGAALLWRTQWAAALERWRRQAGSAIPRWISATATFESLLAFAAYSYEHPADPFPEVSDGPPCFYGESLSHPLLPSGRAIPNNVELSRDVPVWIVSGSNMSGKSTLLRTVGLNAVLACAGAPVRARRLVLSPLQVAASIHLQDSLRDGRSRFYAEISRLRRIVDLTSGPYPVLFLLDELLSGTNSHDRRIGAEALVRGLVERGALGLLTTHDLALSAIANEISPPGANVHFADHIDNGRMQFDYRLHPGVVNRSNALELMRSVGLEV